MIKVVYKSIVWLSFLFICQSFAQSSSSYRLLQSSMSTGGGSITSSSHYLKESAVGGFATGLSSSIRFVLNGGMLISSVDNPLSVKRAVQEFCLMQNFPNPFNPSTTIPYSLGRDTNVLISIYNSIGQIVKCPVTARQAAGQYSYFWDGLDKSGQPVPSGIYYYQIKTEGFTQVRRMLLLK
jgi:hypothetical protein